MKTYKTLDNTIVALLRAKRFLVKDMPALGDPSLVFTVFSRMPRRNVSLLNIMWGENSRIKGIHHET